MGVDAHRSLRLSVGWSSTDDDEDLNLKVNELLYRRLDLADAVDAHILAAERAPQVGFRRYVVSATSPFVRNDLAQLHRDAPAVVRRLRKIQQTPADGAFTDADAGRSVRQ